MGIWYTSAEQPLRLEAYYCMQNPHSVSTVHVLTAVDA